jgi:glycosyltransferase involved in cell wall biosynthesis
MLISVCIPTYNGEKYLVACVESILRQTFKNFELLIVDDSSSDNTLQIAQDYEKLDNRIRVVSNKQNLGLVGNWNRCIELAKGEWIKFVFQDDWMALNCLEKMVSAIGPKDYFVFCRRGFNFEENTPKATQEYYLNHSKKVHRIFADKLNAKPEDIVAIASQNIGFNFIGEPTSVILNRKVFKDYGLFNENLIHICDADFWTRIAIHIGVRYVPEQLVTFRVHINATTSKNQSSRKFRKNVLDPLVMWHDVAFHSTYLPLRQFLRDQALDTEKILQQRMKKAYQELIRDPNVTSVADWNDIVALYPRLNGALQNRMTLRIKRKVGTLKEVFRDILRVINRIASNVLRFGRGI